MAKKIFQNHIYIPHRKFHDELKNLDLYRYANSIRFSIQTAAFGLSQSELSYDFKQLYENKEWITPAPQNFGLYNETAIPRYKKLEKIILSSKRDNSKILEIGGGNTFIAEQISKISPKSLITCIDPSYETQSVNESIQLVHGFFPDDHVEEKYDLIYSFNTLEHIPNLDSFMKSIYKSINTSGSVILSFPECSKQIFNGDWNLFSQQHVNYFVAPYFFDFFSGFGFDLKSYDITNDEAIVELAVKKNVLDTAELYGKFEFLSNLGEIHNRFLERKQYFEDILLRNSQNLDQVIIHGATGAILNLISNMNNSNLLWDSLQIIDNDPLKYNKFLSGFRRKIQNLDSVQEMPEIVLIASETFANDIIGSWRSKFPRNNISFIQI